MSVVRDAFSLIILWYMLVVYSGGKHQLKKNTEFKKIKFLSHLLSASLDLDDSSESSSFISWILW